MRQVLQNLGTGVLATLDIPCPRPRKGEALVRTSTSLISAGTERMLLEFGEASLLQKARQQPDKVRQVVDKIRTDGLLQTLETVRAKLDSPIALGYSNVGVVLEGNIAPGTRIVSNGPHAEVVCVPTNLTCVVPPGVSDEAASFTVVGAIALEGIRLLGPTLGETIGVTGLGVIGLLAVQLLRAHGCRVLAIDLDKRKLAIAETFGAETVNLAEGTDAVGGAERMTGGRGLDGVLITAATNSDEPVHCAAQMCRKRGRIVLTGVTGLRLSRDDFYKKELSFQVSCSYGPGRYDPAYEQQGQDYPAAYVRWTARRNFEAVLQMLAENRLRVESLITHRFAFEKIRNAYELLGGTTPYLGILLDYPEQQTEQLTRRSIRMETPRGERRFRQRPCLGDRIGVIGAGAYATKVLLPALQGAGANLTAIASSTGITARHAAQKFGIESATTDTAALLSDRSIAAIVVATRHDSHFHYVREALKMAKHVFVEKPLALRVEDLDEMEKLHAVVPWPVMVGFNRRFAPHSVKMRQLLATTNAPKCVVVTVNAGAIPRDHWTQDEEVSGGRLVGEGCHFIDLARFLVGQAIVQARWSKTGSDIATLHIAFADSSQASVHYFSNGNRSYPKERVQVFVEGKILELDNWQRLRGYGWKGFDKLNLWRQDKGNAACVSSWLTAVTNNTDYPIPFAEIMEVSRWTLLAMES